MDTTNDIRVPGGVVQSYGSELREFLSDPKTNTHVSSKAGPNACFCCGKPTNVRAYRNIVPEGSGAIRQDEMFVCADHYDLFVEVEPNWLGLQLGIDAGSTSRALDIAVNQITEREEMIASALAVFSTTEGQ